MFLRFLNKKRPKRKGDKVFVSDTIDLNSLIIQYRGKENLKLEDKVGEMEPPYDPSSPKGIGVEEKELLSEIIKKINEVFGIDFQEEDKFCLNKVNTQLIENMDLDGIMKGNNSLDDKKEYFINLFKDYIGYYYSDRMEFHKKVMDKKVFPMIIDSMFSNYMKQMGL